MPDASFLSSDLFLLTITVGLYCLGGAIYRRTRLPLLHPVLLTFVAVIVFLRCAGIWLPRAIRRRRAYQFRPRDVGRGAGIPPLRTTGTPARKPAARGHRHPRRMRRRGAERGLHRHDVRYRTPDTDLHSPQIGHGADRRVGLGTAGRQRVGDIGGGFSAWEFSAASSANGYCVAAASAIPRRGDSRSEPPHTASGRPGPSKWGAAEGALSGLAMALMGLATALLMPLIEKYLY